MEKTPEVKNQFLESIRGIAALLVMITHFIANIPELAVRRNHVINLFGNWATEAVIIFFVLSGIVIHASFDKRPRTKSKFLIQRIARLHPTLLISVILCIIVEITIYHNSPNFSLVIGNLIPFSTLDGNLCDVFWNSNPVIWTLTFELFFYLFFAIVIIKDKKISHLNMLIWLFISLVSLKFYYVKFDSAIVRHFAQLFAFSSMWIVGFYIWNFKNKISINLPIAIFSVLTLPLISRLKITGNYYDPIRFLIFALSSIPFFIYVLCPAKTLSKTKAFWYTLSVLGIIYLSSAIWMMKTNSYAQYIKYMYISLPLFALLFINKMFKNILSFFVNHVICPVFSYFGKLSYPIYLLHYPIMVFICNYFNFPIAVKICLICIITFLFSYFIEIHLQPFINKKVKSLM